MAQTFGGAEVEPRVAHALAGAADLEPLEAGDLDQVARRRRRWKHDPGRHHVAERYPSDGQAAEPSGEAEPGRPVLRPVVFGRLPPRRPADRSRAARLDRVSELHPGRLLSRAAKAPSKPV